MQEPALIMPAEWEPQAAVWLAWPHQHRDWPGKFAPIPLVYGEIIRHITRTELVKLIVRDAVMREKALGLLEDVGVDLDQVRCYEIATNRVWLRDSGPIFVRRGRQKIGLDWKFNAWAKYSNWRHDDRVPEQIVALDGLSSLQPRHGGRRVVLEGGSIDVNGAGLLLTTEECLLDQAVQCRNPSFPRADYEKILPTTWASGR